jgi:hypothetical protein
MNGLRLYSRLRSNRSSTCSARILVSKICSASPAHPLWGICPEMGRLSEQWARMIAEIASWSSLTIKMSQHTAIFGSGKCRGMIGSRANFHLLG